MGFFVFGKSVWWLWRAKSSSSVLCIQTEDTVSVIELQEISGCSKFRSCFLEGDINQLLKNVKRKLLKGKENEVWVRVRDSTFYYLVKVV